MFSISSARKPIKVSNELSFMLKKILTKVQANILLKSIVAKKLGTTATCICVGHKSDMNSFKHAPDSCWV